MEPFSMHSKDGLYWKRMPNGDVEITKYENAEDNVSAPEFYITLSASEWASVVAFVSKYGETSASYMSALRFHDAPIEGRQG